MIEQKRGRVLSEEEISAIERRITDYLTANNPLMHLHADKESLNLIATIRDRNRQIVELKEREQDLYKNAKRAARLRVQNAILLEALEWIATCWNYSDNPGACEMMMKAREALSKVRGGDST